MKGYSENRQYYIQRLVKKYVETPVYTVTKNQMRDTPYQKWDKVWLLTILWEIEKRKWWAYEKCECECWTIKFISRWHLRSWRVKSCWCLLKKLSTERILKINMKHWMYGTHIYKSYMRAKDRCNNKNNSSYPNYWWRWIRFLRNNFEDFYNDMWESYGVHLAKYGRKDTTLDRVDVDWNYCKENCRWATIEEQNNNRRTNTRVVYLGKEYSSINKLAEAFWIKNYILHHRLKYGRSLKDAIETPVEKRNFIKSK